MQWPQESPLKLRDRPAEVRACFCTGPRNGDPVCPCKMRERVEHDLGRWIDEVKRQTRPRFRVKAISRRV